jgi:cytoskeletal protein CcmA (bactofilin family)
MKKIYFFIIPMFVVLVFPFSAHAFTTKTDNSIYVSPNEIVNGNFYTAGQNITIDGKIEGDLVATAKTIIVNGEIDGDVIAVATDITINGQVNGNVRIISEIAKINGQINHNLNVISPSIIIGPDSQIAWDALILSETSDIRGNINGSLHGHADNVNISGQINQNVDLNFSKRSGKNDRAQLYLNDDAIIKGDLKYTSKNNASISQSAQIGGSTQKIAGKEDKTYIAKTAWHSLNSIFSAFIVGLIVLFLWRKKIKEMMKQAFEKSGISLAWGAIVLITTPIIALILAITIIGLPLAAIMIALWIMLIYLAKIFSAILLGEFLIKKIFKKNTNNLIWEMILGVFLAWVLFAIPIVGWIFGLIAICLGLGTIFIYLKPKK